MTALAALAVIAIAVALGAQWLRGGYELAAPKEPTAKGEAAYVESNDASKAISALGHEGSGTVDGAAVEKAGTGWKTIPEGYDPDADEWPGASLGFVGPNGEGEICGSDYESNEEYLDAISARRGGIEQEVEAPIVSAPEGEGDYIEGCLGVTFPKSCSEFEAHLIIERAGGVWCRDNYYLDAMDTALATVYFPEARTYDALLEIADTLATDPQVIYARPDYILEDYQSGSDMEDYGASPDGFWNDFLSNAGFRNAWEKVRCNKAVTIAVIGGGFDLDHPDLKQNFVAGWDMATGGRLTEDKVDADGHGTMVAGVAGAYCGNAEGIEGASYNAKIMPVNRIDSLGRGGINQAVEALSIVLGSPVKVDVINMSFGSYTDDPDFQDVIERLYARGIVLVAAAGNSATAKKSLSCLLQRGNFCCFDYALWCISGQLKL